MRHTAPNPSWLMDRFNLAPLHWATAVGRRRSLWFIMTTIYNFQEPQSISIDGITAKSICRSFLRSRCVAWQASPCLCCCFHSLHVIRMSALRSMSIAANDLSSRRVLLEYYCSSSPRRTPATHIPDVCLTETVIIFIAETGLYQSGGGFLVLQIWR